MSGTVEYDLRGHVALLRVVNPPVNAMSQAVRQAFVEALDRLAGDDAAQAAVIVGAGRMFIGGADISEFGKPPQRPTFADVIERIEGSDKPIVAAIHGAALGGGLEVALGAHARVAAQGARVGLPEVTLGILPGAGGTQRLPRLVGAEAALEIIAGGKPLSADKAHALGIIDALTNGDIADAGIEHARALVERGEPPRRTGKLPPVEAEDALFDNWREKARKRSPGQVAPAACVDAVSASRQPIEAGLKEERRLFEYLMETPQRAGLIHAFFAERRVAKLPEIKGVEPRRVERIGVIGGGTMGSGIASAALLSGLSVDLVERDEMAAEAARDRVEKVLAGSVKRGKLSETDRDTILSQRFRTGTDDAPLAEADLVIEAVFESMEVKREVFDRLDKVARPGAILATNTSYLDVNEIAAETSRPADVIGLHFFSPAHVMKLLEVVVGDRTAPDVVATGFALARRMSKVAVRAGVCDGFIGNRILARYRTAADHMVLDGAHPYQIDDALEAFGFAMGPFAVSDLAGLDIGWATRKRKAPTRDPRERVPTYADALCEMGRFGQKTGRGFYLYEGRERRPDPELDSILAEARKKAGSTAREFTDDEIVSRYMAAMIDEGARVVDEGIALRPSDVDVVFLSGYGFPRWRGGPMHYADSVGLDRILADIRAYGEEDDFFWQPSPLLERLVAEGRDFDSLNKETP